MTLLQQYGLSSDLVGKVPLTSLTEFGEVPENQRTAVTSAWNLLEARMKLTTTGRVRSATRIQSVCSFCYYYRVGQLYLGK